MKSDAPKNIFEAVGRDQSARHQPSTTEAKTVSVPTMLARCRQLHEDIAHSLDRMFTARGITPRQYQDYVSNQQNFSKEEWEAIENAHTRAERKLQELAARAIVRKKKPEEAAVSKEGQKPPAGPAEIKHRPPSRRQWLQMH